MGAYTSYGYVQVGYFWPEVDKLGEIQYETPADIYLLQPSQRMECQLKSDLEAGKLPSSTSFLHSWPNMIHSIGITL